MTTPRQLLLEEICCYTNCWNIAKYGIYSKEPYSETYACFWHLVELSDPVDGDVIRKLEVPA